ncbi:MAG: acyl-CoA dehydrogenase [Deltaproteobacteria bacterium CG2_30_63_29]|nr:MAG: acyl-CoA dehydrogenase [Deltaproteobacteria bacterium CG2_30_63_29]PJB47410.1 MAG: acyl-CoA dehydrogenase [Deltaproteobacteria bacterium CG_4_9_14_3_um_filter_63_12]
MLEHILSPEQLALRAEVRELVKWVPTELILGMDQDEIQFPKEFLQEAGRRGLMGVRYPKEVGGRGLSWVDTVMVMEEVAVLGYIFGCVFGVGAELVCDAIVNLGTKEQIDRYVKPLLAGELFAAECLTEPRGGSDFFGTTTTAVRDGDDWSLNGAKRFIVGGQGADYFLVYARTNPTAAPHKGLTCFLVDRSDGVETTYLHGLMGCRGGGAARVIFKDVRVPKRNVLGRIDGALDVFYPMMIPERLGTAAMTVGAALPALEIATRYTSKRKAFGQRINEFQGVSFQIAQARTLLDVSQSMTYSTALAVDRKAHPNKVRRLVSETKKFVTESCQEVARLSMQVMGGIGYTNVFPVERIVRDLGLASIWTGTNEIMSLIIGTEWYKEYETQYRAGRTRDPEPDAAHADDTDEKVYE